MLSLPILLKAFLSILILFSGSWFIGQLVFYRRITMKGLNVQLVFEQSLLGLLMIVSLFAIYQTGFKTILLPIPLVLLAFFPGKKTISIPASLVSRWSLLVALVLASLFYFIYYGQSFVDLNSNVLKYSSGDISFYARLGDYLNDLGRENSSIDYLYPSRFTVEPYHYWDIWLGALSTKMSGLNPHFAKVLIVYPFLSTLFSLGVFILGLRFCSKRNYLVYILFLAALFSGLVFLFPVSLFKTDIYAVSPAYYGKTLIVGVFLVFILFIIIEKNWRVLIPAVTIAAIGYVNIAPTIFVALALFLIFILFIRKEVTLRELILPAIASVILVAYFAWFYHGSTGNIQGQIEYSARTSASIFAGGLFQFFVILPFLWLGWKGMKLSFRNISFPDYGVFFLLLPLCGLFSWAMLWNKTNEAVQFFFVVFIPFCAIAIGMIISMLLNSSDNLFKYTGIFYLALVLIQNSKYNANTEEVSKNDYNSLKAFVEKRGRGAFVNLKDHSEFTSFFSRSTMVYRPLNWFSYVDRNYQNYSLDAPYIPYDTTEKYAMVTKSLLDRAPYSYFVKTQMGGDASELRKHFIKENKIRYLSLSPLAEYPGDLGQLFMDSVKLESGWRVYYLSNL
jgi:hypothetical protein